MSKVLTTVSITVLLAEVAAAHPGHGLTDGTQAAHYLTEPVHLLGLLATLAIAMIWSRLRRTARTLRPDEIRESR